MNRKLRDANIEEKKVRREYGKASMELNKVIPKGSEVDTRFRITMRIETEKVWREGKNKNKAKTLSKDIMKANHEFTIEDLNKYYINLISNILSWKF